MLEVIDGAVVEQAPIASLSAQNGKYFAGNMQANMQSNLTSSGLQGLAGSHYHQGVQNCWPNATQTVYWNSYPVYVCTDKTAKAIEILKALQADKITEVVSVSQFIELVEKIASIL